MKRIFITSVIALALVLGSAAVANAALTSYMGVGSSGAQVSELQTWLINNGYAIPAISSGAAQKGYFGQQTKAAVAAYQSKNGIPNTGFFGPLTLASVTKGGSVAGSPMSCPIGYQCIPTAGQTTSPVANNGTLTPGTDGSLTVSLSSYAGNNTIKKGETKDLVAVKLQATAAPVAVTRFDARFDKRPWLYFSTITLKDSDGNVIATKNLSSSADATEITVGTDYLVRFESLNYVVSPGTDRTLVVAGTVQANTDKLTSDVTVNVAVPSGSIRTINGKGYTDSLGLSGTNFTAGTTGRTATLSSSGSTGNVLGKLAPDSPDNRIVTTSTSGETNGVVLGKWQLKSENQSSTVNQLKFILGDNNGEGFTRIFKRLYVTNGTQTVQADSIGTTSTFSNLTFALPKDEWKTITLIGDVADQDEFVAGTIVTASSTVNTTNIVGIDANFTTLTASAGNQIPANTVTFLAAGASVSLGTTPVTVVPVDNGTSAVNKKDITFTFTVNNTGSNDIYIPKDPYIAVGTTTTFGATSTTFASITGGASRNGDTSTVYIVSAGQSRTFTVSGQEDMTRSSTSKQGEVKITTIYFGDDTAGAVARESSITSGLDALTTGVNSFQ
jgi:peptidoglycan hydrolase-like protein with peptidoglycan-binding domain